jgi:CHC2 zinc finger/Toprim-like
MSDILEAKKRLPLPVLMEREGLGEHAKKSALCPFHDDKHNSLSVWSNGDGLWFWKCHAGCGDGDEITFLERHRNVAKSDATKLFLKIAGVNGAVPSVSKQGSQSSLDWHACVDAFSDLDAGSLVLRRRYSRPLCCWLKENGLIGKYKECFAFPVHDRAKNVVAVHYRLQDGSWRYHPQGAKVRPLVIGKLIPSGTVHVFESPWDAFSFMDVSGERSDIVITRGAANGKLVFNVIPDSAAVYLWTQNDAAGEKWQRDICAIAKAAVRRIRIPAPHKDLNDWTRAGATADDLLMAIMNAVNSQFLSIAPCDDYPKPLAPEAFYGVAGEIVRRIEPHTEGDSAALLFQFLAAFGNLIGHDHYIVADGTRHYLNVYGVLVGQSSKGRKGTSWNHVANVIERVEPDWRQDRISFGLSSGEGLIWAVRDPIEETRPIRQKGRYTGEYETYIANHGEDDKRLLVIESEFANVLKVMAREGNTLSPIIRSAWDCGDLKTMVKNSPTKASKAHISILGHITREELRRLLTQTESANGFANRFCWLAVKRSKCLPDGGAIHTVNFDDVVAQLQSAVDFAKDFLEIVRDPEAKELWRAIYPDLSEGKPGMLGAITGRAEAQVMRLSAIYALLDKSKVIRPEHHRAAMALWRYCEESCRWIFGTNTGDRNADKILVALRHAPNGMTKTEISAEVFNRHASSTEIDEALRLLHGLRMASYRIEASGGAPIQRWFSTDENREKSKESRDSFRRRADNSLISQSNEEVRN